MTASWCPDPVWVSLEALRDRDNQAPPEELWESTAEAVDVSGEEDDG